MLPIVAGNLCEACGWLCLAGTRRDPQSVQAAIMVSTEKAEGQSDCVHSAEMQVFATYKHARGLEVVEAQV